MYVLQMCLSENSAHKKKECNVFFFFSAIEGERGRFYYELAVTAPTVDKVHK